MASFVKAGNRLINLEQVTHIRVWPREKNDEVFIVDVATLATAGKDRDGVEVEVIIVLENEEAAEFLRHVGYRGENGTQYWGAE